MEKEYNDLSAALKQLEDEVKGIREYQYIVDSATCPILKKLAGEHLAGERQHALNLSSWIHSYIGKTAP